MAYALWERQTLESYFNNNWSETPIKWENRPFTLPRANGNGNGIYAPYVAFMLRSGTGVTVSLGSSLLERQASMVMHQVFIPEFTDSLIGLEIVDLLLDLWIPKDFTDGANVIRTRPAYANEAGENQGWFQTNVFVPYILDTPIPNYI